MSPLQLLEMYPAEAIPSVALYAGDESFKATKVLLKPAEIAARPSPLLMDPCKFGAQSYDWISKCHAKAWGQVQELGCYVFNNISLAGRMHIGTNGKIICTKDLMPEYWRKMVIAGVVQDLPGKLQYPCRELNEPAIIIGTIGYETFGHWILDILPRLWIFEQTFGKIKDSFKLVLPANTPEYGLDFIKWIFGVSPDQIEKFSPNAETLFLRVAYVPTLIHTDYIFHSSFKTFLDELVAKSINEVGETLCPRVYVSRRKFETVSVSTKRCLINAIEIEKQLHNRGYEILYPEELPWPKKISQFAGARICVGEFGSGLHSMLFSRPGAAVVAFRWMNATQSGIAALRNHRNIFLMPENEDEQHRFTMHPMHIDAAVDIAERYARDAGVWN